jgi:hypothetical protein
MVPHNYISKYCGKKIELHRKYPKLWIIFLYIMYLTTFDINIIIYFQAKNNFMLVTPQTERYEGVQHILNFFLSWWFPRLHIMWIYHCNVGKTKQLKKNVKENIWCHQKMNRKKCVYFDNDPKGQSQLKYIIPGIRYWSSFPSSVGYSPLQSALWEPLSSYQQTY